MDHLLRALDLRIDQDLVAARQSARDVSQSLGLNTHDQIRVATVVSEIVRNALRYAGGGRLTFWLQREDDAVLVIQVSDRGPGIANLDDILGGRYRSDTGMGLGLVGAFRLMDHCHIDTEPGLGTTVTMHKRLPAPAAAFDATHVQALVQRLSPVAGAPVVVSSLDELQRQNHELVTTLAALRERQDELSRLGRELEDTNRGVVALYAELEDQAQQLRRNDEMKSAFLSNVSHEFRTPLSSIRALSKLLLSGVDGKLNPEQSRQVGFVLKATQELSELVNDLLDLAKIESGRVSVSANPLTLDELFGALRGTLKPLLTSPEVALVFDAPPGLPALFTDEPKLTQILRNLVSNALKFTVAGEVRVACEPVPGDPGRLRLSVCDTGIGLAPEHLDWIFEEFAQVENDLQRHHKGTGLGLPLCRKLAHLLGGRLEVESTPGVGSCFHLTIPMHVEARDAIDTRNERLIDPAAFRAPDTADATSPTATVRPTR